MLKDDWFKNIDKIASLLLIIPIVTLYSNESFYTRFGIKVFHYLQFSDLLSTFFPDFVSFSAILLLVLIFESNIHKLGFIEINWKYVAIQLTLFIASIATLYFSMKYYVQPNDRWRINILFGIESAIKILRYSSFPELYWFLALILCYRLVMSQKEAIKWTKPFFYIMVSFLVIEIYNVKKANAIISHKVQKNEVKLFLEDNSVIACSSDTLYLGQTNSHTFFYIPKENNSLIISNDRVKRSLVYWRR